MRDKIDEECAVAIRTFENTIKSISRRYKADILYDCEITNIFIYPKKEDTENFNSDIEKKLFDGKSKRTF